jgi:transposase-like protein
VGETRLPAAERRQAIVDAVLRVFVGGSYSGATTAEIAREAGVSEPILYRTPARSETSTSPPSRKKRKRPRLRLRGRFLRQAATGRHSESVTLRLDHGPAVAAVAVWWRALALEALASGRCKLNRTVRAMSPKVK